MPPRSVPQRCLILHIGKVIVGVCWSQVKDGWNVCISYFRVPFARCNSALIGPRPELSFSFETKHINHRPCHRLLYTLVGDFFLLFFVFFCLFSSPSSAPAAAVSLTAPPVVLALRVHFHLDDQHLEFLLISLGVWAYTFRECFLSSGNIGE